MMTQCVNCGATDRKLVWLQNGYLCTQCAGEIMAERANKGESVNTRVLTRDQAKQLKKVHPKYKFSNFIRSQFNKKRLEE